MIERGEDQTDWTRVDAMTEEELEAAIASDPDWADISPDSYQHAKPHYPERLRKEVRLRLDPDLVARFKRQGPGYQARINATLRAFFEAHERAGRE
ncbi:MAG: BrnA antitoxin family protein [Geminicoccaceae bacterium]